MEASRFRWQKIAGESPTVRMQIQEKALDDGIDQLDNHIKFIEEYIGDNSDTNLPCMADIDFLKKWTQDARDLASDRNALELLIGVQGQTGAGKSSLLNAILECSGLLPSSNAEASTATICRVAFNHSDEPKELFRAVVNFRTYKDVKEELDYFFGDLQEREKLLSPDAEDANMTDEEKSRMLEELAVSIQDTADKIEVVKYIGSTKMIHGSDREEFSAKIKPFLDSTYTELTGKSGVGNRAVALWPLIDWVDIYIKAPILKGGLVLVDLPGLSDVVGGRAAVAKRYYEKLAVAVIVTPCVRAADERTGVTLMTENQELQMRMDGKLDDRGYCVVLSKADDISWKEAIPTDPILKENSQRLNSLRNQEVATNTSMEAIKGRIATQKTAAKSASDQEKKKALAAEVKTLKATREKYYKTKKGQEKKRSALEASSTFHAVAERNKTLTRRIIGDLKKRHNNFMSRSLVQSEGAVVQPFVQPRIFPVSSKAYWNVVDGKPTPGFPTARYTGIPALVQWLREATIPQRERQVRGLLHRLLGLFQRLRTWSDDQCRTHKLKASLEELETALAVAKSDELGNMLQRWRKKAEGRIKRCDPCSAKGKASKFAAARFPGIVETWIMRYPGQRHLTTKLSPLTFKAIVRRRGKDFTSRAGGLKLKYNWMEATSMQYKEWIVQEWTDAMHKNLPGTEVYARRDIEGHWKNITDALVNTFLQLFPDLKGQEDYIRRQIAGLVSILEELMDKYGQRIAWLSSQSPSVHGALQEDLTKRWQPGFAIAEAISSGSRLTQRRHAALVEYGTNGKGKHSLTEAANTMEAKFETKRQRVIDGIKLDCKDAQVKFEERLRLIINNMVEPSDTGARMHVASGQVMIESEESRNSRLDLQRGIRLKLIKWADVWNLANYEAEEESETDIPKKLTSAAEDDDDDDDDDSDDDDDGI
ncbi:hypothetical protein QBC34DRAFT_462913 [Podospora aff. communis PSN243]|uniref:Dynamin N-terminal domain-containing protein n=1 Tax=Podospora aff. communis PSN243 TaxID=3040156 RepID=A0AAV9GM53_9PEZI|nr:hypothetical protein QBC34DRAFT_462913 [Podospora aff. communis PSN243]